MIFIRTLINFLKDPEYRALIYTTLFILTMGTFVYHHLEGWSYFDSFYFSMITLSTIGYGDFSPQSTGGKLFTIFYIILGIGMIFTFINTVYRHFEKEREEEERKKYNRPRKISKAKKVKKKKSNQSEENLKI